MAFSWNPYKLLAVTSNKGTLHLFDMADKEKKSGWVMKGTRGVAQICPPGLDHSGDREDRWITAFLRPTVITPVAPPAAAVADPQSPVGPQGTEKEYVSDPTLVVISSSGKFFRFNYDRQSEELLLTSTEGTSFM